MKFFRSLSLVAFAGIASLAPTRAFAVVGLEVSLRPGLGSAGSDSPVLYKPTGLAKMQPESVGSIWAGTAKPYGVGITLDAAVGYRFSHFASVGIAGGWRQSGVDDKAASDQLTNVGRSALQIGLYGRGYLPTLLPNLDPWFSVGVAYLYDKQTYDQSIDVSGLGKVPFTISLQHHGLGIPIGVGLDFKVLRFLALGASVQYEIVPGVAACMETSPHNPNMLGVSECSTADSKVRVTSAETYGTWSAGLDVRLSL